MAGWDIVVVTASNENQAKIYEQYIHSKILTKIIDTDVIYKVITDDNGKRIGSGGSTLSVLHKLSEEFDVENKKILLIHSGGDSKRIPQYSATGKLFSPVLKCNKDGSAATVFDELLENVKTIPEVSGNGMLVMSGDVIITFDGVEKDSFNEDAVALTAKVPVEDAVHHGVFCSENSIVKRFLHKCSADVLKANGAVSDNGVDIDTGMIFLNGKIIKKLTELVSTQDNYDFFVNDEVRLNFYGDFVYPLAQESTLEDYLIQGCEFDCVNDRIIECRKILWNILHGMVMKNSRLIGGRFIHVGTTPQFLELVRSNDLGWEKSILCNNGYIFAYNSFVSTESEVKGYVENSVIRQGVYVGENSVVSGAYLQDCTVPDNTVISLLKLNDGKYCLRVYPVDCNPKENNLWDKQMFPVFDDYQVCGQVLEHFIKCDAVYDSYTKMSFKESFENSSRNTEIESEIKKYRRRFYLNKIKRNIIHNTSFELTKEQSECRLPLRVNFGGGWTDTAPYTNEFGGKVLNAAIKLDDKLPVICTVKKINKRAFALISKDLNTRKEITKTDVFFDFDIKDNDFSIHKAVCIACGLIKQDTDLENFFDLYGGVEITTQVQDVPKGSGLGTSSILCAAAADAMYQFMGIDADEQMIFNTVLTMEQLMQTGGGWQDQVGGYVKGFKLTTSPKGVLPNLTVKKLKVPQSFIEKMSERYILIYTGQKRMARNLLKTVMDNVYNRDECFAVMNRIKELADEMTNAIESSDVDTFAELLNEHWICSKILDEGTSNENIETIYNTIKDYICGFFISGAGGGGFLQIILKNGVSRQQIERLLEQNSKIHENVRIYNASFDC